MTEQPNPDPTVPTTDVASRHFVGEMDRFDRLFSAGFENDPTVAAAVERVESLLPPPPVVDSALQQMAWTYAQGMREDAAAMFAPLYYSCMRNGWGAAEAVLHVRGVTLAEWESTAFDAAFQERLSGWSGTNPWDGFSDLAYYLLDDLTPVVREHVQEVMVQAVPGAELPDNWDMIPPLRGPLDIALNAVLVAAAAALAAANVDVI